MFACLTCCFTVQAQSKSCCKGAAKSCKDKTEASADAKLESASGYKIAGFEKSELVCLLSTKEQAERKSGLQADVFSQMKDVEELENGYKVTFPYDEAFIIRLTDYVVAENNCCPFFSFQLNLHGKEDIALSITGPAEAKEILGELLTSAE